MLGDLQGNTLIWLINAASKDFEMITSMGHCISGRQLHIGALTATHGWETLNAIPLPGIDHVCDAGDLSLFSDNIFQAIYASHVLEHFDYKDTVPAVLKEWLRVLAPGGQLFVSVPDLDAISRMLVNREKFDAQDRWNLSRMLIGGHVDQYDYHQSLFNEDSLVYFLEKAGFVDIRRGQEFKIFSDTSSMRYKNELISLNILAVKPSGAVSANETSCPPELATVDTEAAGYERKAAFSISRNGSSYSFQYQFDTRQLTQRALAAHIQQGRLYEPEVSLLLMRVLRGGDCFVDVGANTGFFSIIAAHLVGNEGAVYAFEPEAINFKRLALNVSLNSLSNLKLFQAAVGNRNGVTNLYINRDNDGGHALWDPGAHSFNQLSRESVELQQTDMLTIDSVFCRQEEDGRHIKIIKIDTEGYEHHTLMGAVETIRSHRVPFILAEINRLGLRQSGSNERTFRLFMHHLGYTAYIADFQEELSLQFLELPMNVIPAPDDPEFVYNVTFCLPGEMERYGFTVLQQL